LAGGGYYRYSSWGAGGGTYARYLPSGHLIFIRQQTLFAAPFDLKGLELSGGPSASRGKRPQRRR
jgi:hypothetical protein